MIDIAEQVRLAESALHRARLFRCNSLTALQLLADAAKHLRLARALITQLERSTTIRPIRLLRPIRPTTS